MCWQHTHTYRHTHNTFSEASAEVMRNSLLVCPCVGGGRGVEEAWWGWRVTEKWASLCNPVILRRVVCRGERTSCGFTYSYMWGVLLCIGTLESNPGKILQAWWCSDLWSIQLINAWDMKSAFISKDDMCLLYSHLCMYVSWLFVAEHHVWKQSKNTGEVR